MHLFILHFSPSFEGSFLVKLDDTLVVSEQVVESANAQISWNVFYGPTLYGGGWCTKDSSSCLKLLLLLLQFYTIIKGMFWPSWCNPFWRDFYMLLLWKTCFLPGLVISKWSDNHSGFVKSWETSIWNSWDKGQSKNQEFWEGMCISP